MSQKIDRTNQFSTSFYWMLGMDFESASELCIYARIHSLSQGEGTCWESAENIGKWGLVKRRQAIDILQRLEEKGYIEKDSQGAGKTCKYRALLPTCAVECTGEKQGCAVERTPTCAVERTPLCSRAHTNINRNRSSNSKIESISEMEDFNQASSLPIEPTGPVDLTNPASFLRSSSLANSVPSSSTRSTGLANQAPSSSTYREDDDFIRLKASDVIKAVEPVFVEAGLDTSCSNKELRKKVNEMLDDIAGPGLSVDKVVKAARNYLDNDYYSPQGYLKFFNSKVYSYNINYSKVKKVEDEGESIW